MDKLLLAIPGTGFSTKEKLFQVLIDKYEMKGYLIREIDSSMIDFKPIATIAEAVREAERQLIAQTMDIRYKEAKDIVIISKSLGTICAGFLEHFLRDMGVRVRQLYLTPVKETLEYIDDESSVIALVIGDEDALLSSSIVEDFAGKRGIRYQIIKGVGHSLKREREEDSERIILEIAELCR